MTTMSLLNTCHCFYISGEAASSVLMMFYHHRGKEPETITVVAVSSQAGLKIVFILQKATQLTSLTHKTETGKWMSGCGYLGNIKSHCSLLK